MIRAGRPASDPVPLDRGNAGVYVPNVETVRLVRDERVAVTGRLMLGERKADHDAERDPVDAMTKVVTRRPTS